MKKIIAVLLIAVIATSSIFVGCTKENVTNNQTTTSTTSKGTFNCLTTINDAASIQLLDPISPKSWFNLSFCFTPPQQNISNPIIYTNGDSLPVSLQIFVNRVYLGNKGWTTEKIDEYFYYPCFHGYPTPYTRFPQKPALQNGTFAFNINFKFERKGLYNKFINSYGYTYDTTLYNWDAYDFGMHSQTTNSYSYVRLVIKSDKN